MFIYHVIHHICRHPRTGPVRKSSRLSSDWHLGQYLGLKLCRNLWGHSGTKFQSQSPCMDALFALLNITFMVHKNPSLCVGAGPHKTNITKSTNKPSQCNTSDGILLCMQIKAMQTEQYFTVPHLFLQESGHSSGIPVESCRNPVIPVDFQWNP